MGATHFIVGCVAELAALLAATGQLERATRAFGAADALRDAIAAPVPASDRTEYDAEVAPEDVVVHDPTDHELAFALSRLSDQELDHAVFGVIRQVERPTYDDEARNQLTASGADDTVGREALASLLSSGDTWSVA